MSDRSDTFTGVLAGNIPPVDRPEANKLQDWLDDIEDDDLRTNVTDALYDKQVAHAHIVDALRSVGFVCSQNTVSRWRKAHGVRRR